MAPDDDPPEFEIIEAELVAGEAPGAKPFGVPRRFGIGTILVVTTAFGLLLAALRALGAHPGVVAFVVAFISLVGAGQMLLFRGVQPRKASIVAGTFSLPLLTIVAWVLRNPRPPGFGGFPCFVVTAALLGGACGYLAGGVAAGVFLIMDAVERVLPQRREAPEPDDD